MAEQAAVSIGIIRDRSQAVVATVSDIASATAEQSSALSSARLSIDFMNPSEKRVGIASVASSWVATETRLMRVSVSAPTRRTPFSATSRSPASTWPSTSPRLTTSVSSRLTLSANSGGNNSDIVLPTMSAPLTPIISLKLSLAITTRLPVAPTSLIKR